MFVPLVDNNPMRYLPFPCMTSTLVILNVVVYALQVSGLFGGGLNEAVYEFGLVPAVLNDYASLPDEYRVIPEGLTLLTYQFVHGSFLHLLSNMLFLWVFGDNVEDAMGRLRFVTFYLLCGVAAGLAHDFAQPESEAPLVGASGAVSGVIAAYLMLHPHVKVWVLVLWRVPLRLPAMWVLGFWIVLQVFSVLTADATDNVAWWAHIGGLAAGAVLVVFLRRPGVPLFDRGLVVTAAPERY
jgi:rhomboid family protein